MHLLLVQRLRLGRWTPHPGLGCIPLLANAWGAYDFKPVHFLEGSAAHQRASVSRGVRVEPTENFFLDE